MNIRINAYRISAVTLLPWRNMFWWVFAHAERLLNQSVRVRVRCRPPPLRAALHLIDSWQFPRSALMLYIHKIDTVPRVCVVRQCATRGKVFPEVMPPEHSTPSSSRFLDPRAPTAIFRFSPRRQQKRPNFTSACLLWQCNYFQEPFCHHGNTITSNFSAWRPCTWPNLDYSHHKIIY